MANKKTIDLHLLDKLYDELEGSIVDLRGNEWQPHAKKANGFMGKLSKLDKEARAAFFEREFKREARGSLVEACAYAAIEFFSGGRKGEKAKRLEAAQACFDLGRELARLGSNPDAICCRRSGFSPCCFAVLDCAQSGQTALIDFFNSIGADLNACDEKNQTLLQLAHGARPRTPGLLHRASRAPEGLRALGDASGR